MLSLFITKKLASAKYKLLGDGSYFGVIPGLPGVWANGLTLEHCREELLEVLEEWSALHPVVQVDAELSQWTDEFIKRYRPALKSLAKQ